MYIIKLGAKLSFHTHIVSHKGGNKDITQGCTPAPKLRDTISAMALSDWRNGPTPIAIDVVGVFS